ncbi:histidinol phosphate phosphatase HisJ family protein [Phlyctema vagabunda]|uniref:Histidinol-phosphatase n=1 Tax=Phlyctema vagabunda TaxID=108571 RepID=A0ABR4PVB6_9HELO
MAFSMHSHSGQFCPGHAQDSLEQVIQTAISRGMAVFALTEHMPRMSEKDLYPEEISAGETTADHVPRHAAYLQEAVRLRDQYASEIEILIGFEGEFIRSDYAPFIHELAADARVDFFIGSVHHVHGIPIDYDAAFYGRARDAAGGSDDLLFADYLDLQLEMLHALRPKVIGHFDLVRLLAEDPNRDLRAVLPVWQKIVRNLKVVVQLGALLEVNSAALRKGLTEPYPARSICEEFLAMGGMLTLSDDSHGIDQVGTNYLRTIEYVESLGVSTLWTLKRQRPDQTDGIDGKSVVTVSPVAVSGVRASFRG